MAIFAVVDLYFAINANNITKYRLNKFNEHETEYCYFCFYSDLIFSIPFDYSGKFNEEKE